MLRLLANHCFVSLSKNTIALVYRDGLTNSVIGETYLAWQSKESFDWQELIFKLERELDKLNLPEKTKLTFTLSTDMVRYLSLPAQQVAMSQSEKQLFAQAAFKEIYGFITSDWLIRCHDSPPDQPILASAIDQTLFDSLQKIAQKYAFKLMSVQPYLMTAMNALQSQIKNATTILAVVEQSRIVFANLNKGVVTQVRTYPRAHDWQKTLSQLLSRETLINDNNMREIMVYAPAQGKTVIPMAEEWMIKPLKVKQNKISDKPPYAMLEALV